MTQPRDTVSWMRILNVPARGIGKTTLDRLRAFAGERGLTVPEALADPALASEAGAAPARRLGEVRRLFDELAPLAAMPPAACLVELVAAIRFREHLREENPAEAEERIENVEELIAGAEAYARRAEEPTLEGFLAEVTLLTDVDLWDESEDTVNLMTIHSAKGLEFPVVFVVGMEEGLLPHASSFDDRAELEEERRLFYVALTRAQRQVHLLGAEHRRAWNSVGGGPSRFLGEIPDDCLQVEDRAPWDAAYVRPARGARGVADAPAAARSGAGASDGRSPVGIRVNHPQFGEGIVVACEGMGERAKLTVQFRRAGTKKILAAFAELSHVD
jgi:DNA helicase-2/ATP-dependent DNA helicase PcrA